MRFSQRSLLRAFLLVIGAGSLLTGGCRSATVSDSLLPRLDASDAPTQMEFWHTLALRDQISNDEAFHGLLLYMDKRDPAASYADRLSLLKSRHWLAQSFNQPAEAMLTRGTLADALVRALELKGGVTLRVLGPTERYATRELEYRGLYPPSSPNQIFSGSEFVGVIAKVEDFRHGNPADFPAAVMPSQIRDNMKPVVNPASVLAQAEEYDTDSQVSPIYASMLADNLSLQPATAATTTAPAGKAKIRITAVEGAATFRNGSSGPWKPATKGMELTEQAELRTGPDGAIQFVILPDEIVAVDPLTTVKLIRVLREGPKAATDLGIKYGRTRYGLEGGGLEHQSTLRSPNATLAVRGTQVSLYDQRPFTPLAVSLTGRAEFAALRRQAIAFGARGQGKTRITPPANNPGEVALADTVIDPTLSGARTESEAALVQTFISRGATVTIDRTSGLPIIRGGIPPTDAMLLSSIPGDLKFVLRWPGDVNLDLAVVVPTTPKSPQGEFIAPIAGLNISPSGGQTFFDHQGGSPAGGVEVVSFKTPIQTDYVLAARYVNGVPKQVDATFRAYLNGQPLMLTDFLNTDFAITQTVTPGVGGDGLALLEGTSLSGASPSIVPQAVVRRTPLSPAFLSPSPVQGPSRQPVANPAFTQPQRTALAGPKPL